MQYTVRGMPAAVDSALRERARADGTSLNGVAVEALAEGSGAAGRSRKRRDLADVAGTWKAQNTTTPAVLEERTDLTPPIVGFFVRNGVSAMPFFRKTEISDADLDAMAAYLPRTRKP